MHIAIFGATGKTGRHVVDQALARGHRVRAFTRRPDAIDSDHPNLDVARGDARDPDAVHEAVRGVDAVISVLGPTDNTPDHQVERGTRHLVSAMERAGVSRLIVTAGAGVGDERDAPGVLDRIVKALLLLFARHAYRDMRETVEVVRESSLAWTVVRLPMLTDGPAQGEVRVGYVGRGTGPRIARPDVARFLLDTLEQDAHIHDAPVISN